MRAKHQFVYNSYHRYYFFVVRRTVLSYHVKSISLCGKTIIFDLMNILPHFFILRGKMSKNKKRPLNWANLKDQEVFLEL